MQGEPEMSTEGRELLALIAKQSYNPMVSTIPGLRAAFTAIGAYVQRAELRMFALETTAQSLAETALAAHYGRGGIITTANLRTIATAARHEPTLRALDEHEAKNRG